MIPEKGLELPVGFIPGPLPKNGIHSGPGALGLVHRLSSISGACSGFGSADHIFRSRSVAGVIWSASMRSTFPEGRNTVKPETTTFCPHRLRSWSSLISSARQRLAGGLHLALEAGDGIVVHHIGIEHFDGRAAAEHGVLPLIDDAHAAGAEPFLEAILAEAFGFEHSLLGFALQARDDEREDKNRDGTQGQQAEDGEKGPVQNGKRSVGLGVVDFGDDAHARTLAATCSAPTDGRPR